MTLLGFWLDRRWSVKTKTLTTLHAFKDYVHVRWILWNCRP